MEFDFPDAFAGAQHARGEIGTADDAGTTASTGAATPWFSGALQNLATMTTGALSRWVDIELQAKAAGLQPQPVLGTTQGPVLLQRAGVPQPGGVSAIATQQGGATLLNLNALLPFVLVGLGAWFLARKT